MGELKPCPFCGMDVACVSDTKELARGNSVFMYTVVCDAHADGCGSTIGYEMEKADAIHAWNRRSTHPQPVTPAGGEVEPVAWMRRSVTYKAVDGRFDGERIISEHQVYPDDVALYTHPPVADAALVELIDEALEQMELHGMHALREYKELKARHRLMDAALNQRGDGGHA